MNKDQAARIAKELLGWEFRKPTHGRCCTCQNCGRDYDSCGDSCYFDEDISAAWPIVEKLRDRGWSVELYTDSQIPARVNLISLRDPIDDAWSIEIDANTMPEAIVSAALRALDCR